MAASNDGEDLARTGLSEAQGSIQVLLNAISEVLTDKGFELPSVKAQKARLCASKLIDAMKSQPSEGRIERFATYIIESLTQCCTHKRAIKCHTLKERMWENYHKLCSSDSFCSRWTSFVGNLTGFSPSPILYMFVTDTIMKLVIKKVFPLCDDRSDLVSSIDYHECNAIRYTAGYVLRSMYKKISRSANPLKTSLLQCLNDLFDDTNDISDMPNTEEWINSIDRGGLIHVSDSVYMVFIHMEMVLRKYLQYRIDTSIKDAIEGIVSDEEVLFYWAVVAVNWDENEGDELLKLICQHWITIRGFSYASAFMENYKQSQKKTTQKAKGLRKTLNTTTDNDNS